MLNSVELIGRVGNVNFSYLSDRTPVANYSVATNNTYKKNGETVTETEWHNCVAWGKTAEIINQYVKKGQLVRVEGSLKKTKPYQNKDGIMCQSYQITTSNILMLSYAKTDDEYEQPKTQRHPTSQPQALNDDDIPF